MSEPTRNAEDWIPADILHDPRHLVRECDGCKHMLETGLCGEDLHPKEEWAKPDGCNSYSPVSVEPSGDSDPETFTDYS